MILINLLPHREARRKQRKQNFFITLGSAAVAGALVVGGWTSVLQQMKAAQQQRNDLLKAEIRKLDTQIKDIATLRAEIQALKDRQAAYDASLEAINRLKTLVPIWKKETFADGEVWVEGAWDDAVPRSERP